MTAAPRGGHAPDAPRDLRILLAEDNTEMRVLLAGQLRREGYDVVECADGQDLVERLASLFLDHVQPELIDLVVSDIRMPAFTGMEILDGLHRDARLPPMILITAFGDAATHARARQLGAVAIFDKPFRVPDLLATIRKTLAPRG